MRKALVLSMVVALVAGFLWWVGAREAGGGGEPGAAAPGGTGAEPVRETGRLGGPGPLEPARVEASAGEAAVRQPATEEGAASEPPPTGGATTYAWRLVDAFGTPLGGIMVRGEWRDAAGEELARTQTFVDFEGPGVAEEVSWSGEAPAAVVLDAGAPGCLPLELRLPQPVLGGRTELGDLELPTLASRFDEPLVTGRVLDDDGSTTGSLTALGQLLTSKGGASMAGEVAVLVDPRSGDFEVYGPAPDEHSVQLVFTAPNRIEQLLPEVEFGTRDLQVRMQRAQVVRLRFELPPVEEEPLVSAEFWGDRLLAASKRYAGYHDLMRPFEAEEFRLVDVRTGFVLARRELPPAEEQMLDLDVFDLTESVRRYEIQLLDGRGEPRGHSSVVLERPDGERRTVAADYGELGFFARRDAGVVGVGLAEGGELQRFDLADSPAALRLP